MAHIDSPLFRRILTRNLALPLAMSAVLIGIFLGVVSYVSDKNDEVARIDHILSEETEGIKFIVDTETGLRGYLLTKDPAFLEPYRSGITAAEQRLDALDKYLGQDMGYPQLLRSVRERFQHWKQVAEAAIGNVSDGKSVSQDAMKIRKEEMDGIRAGFSTIHQRLESQRDELAEAAKSKSRQVSFITALVTLILGGLAALSGRRQLMSLSASYEESLANQALQNDVLTKSAWIRSGQGQLAEKIRGDLGREMLAKQILHFLATYMNAKVGVMYVRNSGNRYERASQFAFSDSKQLKSEFAYGEGLIGQVAETQKLKHLVDVPEDYIKVVSATGEAAPRHILIAPAIADGVVQGVVELGFFSEPSKEAQRLLEDCAEIMGNAIQALNYRMRLQRLLEESQQLTEELQAQQEELRVSNEELEERTKALQETQAKLEGQHAELEQTNEQLEEQAAVLEEQKRSLDEQNQVLEQAREDIEKKAAELESTNRFKSEFLANMSHELRTPLNSTLILATLLKSNASGNLTEEQVEFANTIYSSGNDLLQLINDILDLSKVESGSLDIVPESFPVKDMLASLERMLKPSAEQKGIELRVSWDDVPVTMVGDRLRVEQILKNLLSNAIKFTSTGHVELAARQRGKRLDFSVRDTGIGIAPSQHQIIFEAFRQADGTTSRKYGGTGLGLSISLNLARLMGGDIHVQSEEGKGSCFTLELPAVFEAKNLEETRQAVPVRAEAVHAAPVRSEPKPAREKKKEAPAVEDDRAQVRPGEPRILLVVEDEPKFAELLCKFAHEFDYRCLLSWNVADGMRDAEEYLPTAIILDVRLPDGSGLTLLDRLKQNPKTRHIPVFGLSVQDYSMAALHLGAAGFGLKPNDVNELRSVFAKIEEKLRSQTKRVLIVEDDAVQRDAIVRLIGEKGVEIVSAGTGEEALGHLGRTAFDCMVMDLRLPDMGGNELLENLVKNSVAPIPPVVVYTGKEIDKREEEALSRYSRSIIIKGARSPERLLDEVTLFLHQAENELSAERQRMLRSSRNRERAFEGRTILLVDDDVRNIFALTNALEQKGAHVVVARNGREALERVEKERDLDLILMDVMMPEMDGLEATRRIRGGEHYADIPIIAVTAKAMRDDYEKCLAAGANDYLAKPVDVEKLVSLIRVWLPKRLGGA